ncbi:MAG: TIGR04338 family metallohydrolase [Actinomycetales bacterium]|nr:TIGR04338 family metallohydrolase [Actinomycetales bacterium]
MPAVAVYAAEDQWSAALDRGGVVDFFGSRMDLPTQRRFADVSSVQAYVDGVLARSAVVGSYPDAGPVRVRPRAGGRRAHYEPQSATIALPGELWAGRESVILHELAHHLSCSIGVPRESSGLRWHGREYRETMLRLVAEVLGEPAALLLRAGYDAAGVAS